jgi:hypothetical protein
MPKVGDEELQRLIYDVQEAVAAIPELELESTQVSVFFPPDMVVQGLGEELTAFIQGLFRKRKRTPKVLQRLTNIVAQTLEIFAKKQLKQCRKIEVLPWTLDPKTQGFTAIVLPSPI